MKIAVVQSGQLRLSDDMLRLSDDVLKNLFPNADFFYPVWQKEYDLRKDIVEKISKNSVVEVIKEYDIDYHPYGDNSEAYPYSRHSAFGRQVKKLDERPRHQTKQILNHNIMVKKHLQDYDVIIKTRYDIFGRPYQNWNHVLDIVNEGAVISAYGTGTVKKFYMVYGDDYSVFRHNPHMVIDAGFIMHKPSHWDCNKVERLNKNRELLAAEFGWHQILVEDNPSPYHKFSGGAFFYKRMLKDLYEGVE